jgi:hypothetical protein
MNRRLLLLVSAAALPIVLACVGDSPDLESERDAGGSADASADGASETSTTADAPFSAGLFQNGDFELGCAGWQDYYSNLSEDALARTGSKSCRVCRASSDFYYLAQDIGRALLPGERYVASAWVRSVDGTAAPGIEVVMETKDSASATVQHTESSGTTTSPTWTKVTGLLTVDSDAGVGLHARFGSEFASPGSCFLVDDATLEKLP